TAGYCENPHSLLSIDRSEWQTPQESTATSTSSSPSGPRSISCWTNLLLPPDASVTYSIAKSRLNAGIVDLVMTGSEIRAPAIGWSVRAVEMLTMWPDFCLRICATDCCVMKKYPATFVLIIAAKSSGEYSVNGFGT